MSRRSVSQTWELQTNRTLLLSSSTLPTVTTTVLTSTGTLSNRFTQPSSILPTRLETKTLFTATHNPRMPNRYSMETTIRVPIPRLRITCQARTQRLTRTSAKWVWCSGQTTGQGRRRAIRTASRQFEISPCKCLFHQTQSIGNIHA